MTGGLAMRCVASIGIGLCLTLLPGIARPAGGEPEGGSYEVEVKLELPHLEDMATRKTVRLCLRPDDRAGSRGLAVLSDNNPLAGCPISNVRRDGDELTFDIACDGRNAARATARYVLAPAAFNGRIKMQMGGKNMTMTEVQAGHRMGECGPGAGEKPPS